MRDAVDLTAAECGLLFRAGDLPGCVLVLTSMRDSLGRVQVEAGSVLRRRGNFFTAYQGDGLSVEVMPHAVRAGLASGALRVFGAENRATPGVATTSAAVEAT